MQIIEKSLQTKVGAIPLILLPVPGRSTTSIRAIVNSGSAHEHSEEWGIAHYLEHMAFKGTEKFNVEQLNRELASVGDPNAYTDTDKTVYYLDTIPQFAAKAAEMLAHIFFHSTLPKAEFDLEKTVILQELQARTDSPTGHYFDHASHHFFGVAGHPTIGTAKHIESFDTQHLKAFRARTYSADRLVIAVVGAIPDVEQMVEVVTKAFESEIVDLAATCSDEITAFVSSGENFQLRHPSTQALLGHWWPWFSFEESYKRSFTPRIFANLLGGGLQSLMGSELREKRGLCYACGCFPHGFEKNNGFVAYTMLAEKNIELASQVIKDILKKTRDEGADENLLEVTRKMCLIKATHRDDNNSTFERAVDAWSSHKKVWGNRISTKKDIEEATRLCTQQVVRDLCDYMLQTKHSRITMINDGSKEA